MNKLLTVTLVAIVVLVGCFFVFNSYIYQEKQADDVVSESPLRDVYLSHFEDRSIEIAFDYPDGPDGYVIDDLSEFIGEEPQGIEVTKVYRIMNAKEKLELENSEGGREGPPAIQLIVFINEQKQSASMWVDAFPAFSNIKLVMGEIDRDAVVGGANAVRYTTDGLYVSDNVAIANGDFIYHFSGSYLEADSLIHQDFKGIIDSIRFVPPVDGGLEAEINIQSVCESALAYMLFQTGAQADQFVAECVAGEHPEVIDRYKQETGQGDSSEDIIITTPVPEQKVNSPIQVAGKVRGSWLFEATAPVAIVDWDGRIIGESYIESEGEWMTEDFVPFVGSISYDLPIDSYSSLGTVIFRRANPSGLPQNDSTVEVSVDLR